MVLKTSARKNGTNPLISDNEERQEKDDERRDNGSPHLLTRWPFVIVIICVMAAGVIFAILSAREAEEVMARTMLSHARMLVETIDQERFSRLTATIADEQSQDYHELRDTLVRIRAANPTYRYLYLIGKRGSDPPFFYMGTAPAGTDEYSPPGQPYPEKAPTLAHVLATGEAALSDPVTDRWGTWVSALVPLREKNSGRMLAVFGMDVDASEWQASIRLRTHLTGALTLVVAFLLFSLFFVLRNRQRFRTEYLLLEKNRLLGVQAVELKENSELLQNQKDRYGFIIESTNLGTWEWNVQTGETIFNQRFISMAGYTLAELAPISIATWERLAHPDDLKASHKALERHFKGETNFYECECRIKHKDGHWVWVLDRGKVISRTEEGKPLWAYGTHQDITDRKRAEEELKDNEGRLRAITDSAQDAIILMDPRGAISFWNPASEKILGYRASEAIGRNLHELLAPERYLDAINAAVPEFLRSGQGGAVGRTVELAALHKNGQEIALSLSLSTVSIGGKRHAVGILRDVTGIKRAEEQLRESEERFRGILHNVSAVAVQGFTKDGTVIYWNHASESFYGYTAEEALGRNLLDLIIPPAMHEEVESLIQQMIETGKAIPAGELALMRKDGSLISVYSSHVLVQVPGRNAELFCIDIDLTERKRAQEKLQASEEMFRNIVNASPMGIHIYQMEDDGRLVFTGNNLAADRLLGVDNSAFVGLTIEEAFPSLRDTEVPERYRRAAREGQSWQTEQIDYRDGMISGAFEVYAFQMSQGKIAVLFNEITERKRAEEELKDSEDRARRQRAALSNLVLDTSVMNADLPKAMSQVAKIAALGMEVARAGVWILSEDDSELRCLSMYESGPDRFSQDMVLSTKEFPGYFNALLEESRIYAHDAQHDPRTSELNFGYLVPLGITSMLDAGVQSDGRLVGVVCLEHIGSPRLWKADEEAFASTMAAIVAQIMANDRRRKAEWAQGESEELQRSLLQSIPDLILRTDIEGKITFMNEIGFPGMDSIDRGSLCGKSIFSFVPEQDRPRAMENARQRLETDIGPQEYRLQFEDGTQVDAELNGAVVRDRDGKAVGMVYVVRNISDRKKAEKDKANLQDQLVQAQKMEAVGRLAGGVAHDFNNMLGVILGHTELALLRLGKDESLRPRLEDIQQAAIRSADLTRQLLGFARKQTITPKGLDLNTTIEGMLKLLRRLIGEDIDLLWKPGHEIWSVRMDPSQIDQILVNLCVNSRDAIMGCGKVIIETGKAFIDEEYCARHAGFVVGDYVVLSVSDDGSGMDAETLSHIFEPFFTTKTLGKGTGLGLATVYGIVRQNDGFLNVYSEPGVGTTFTIYLPRHDLHMRMGAGGDGPNTAARGNETVLLVEDEGMILDMTTAMLKELGYTVLTAGTPGEAIRLAKEHTGGIDLLMTDVVMPEMNGRDLAKNLLALFPTLNLLFMSGYTANVIAHHGVLDDGVNFIQKPFTLNDLSVKIREVFDSN